MPTARKKKHIWTDTLLSLMHEQGLTQRSLSLRAGLNETAVRDIVEGRARFPRYDTIRALADALGTTPAYLMGDEEIRAGIHDGKIEKVGDLDLLTEIIARVQELCADMRITPDPKDFARIVSTLYAQLATSKKPHITQKALRTHLGAVINLPRKDTERKIVVKKK